MNARIAGVVLLLLSTLGSATVPHLLDFQGKLAYANGTLYNGATTVIFKLYSTYTGGSALWTETQSVTATNGAFDVILGGVTPLALPFNVPYYLELTVGSEVLSPRLNTTSAPHALYAENATYASNANNSQFLQGAAPGHGNGLDADTVDTLHAADIIAQSGGNNVFTMWGYNGTCPTGWNSAYTGFITCQALSIGFVAGNLACEFVCVNNTYSTSFPGAASTVYLMGSSSLSSVFVCRVCSK